MNEIKFLDSSNLQLCAGIFYINVDALKTVFLIPKNVIDTVILKSLGKRLLSMGGGHWIKYDDLPLQFREMRNFPTETDLYRLQQQHGKKGAFQEHVLCLIKDELNTIAAQSHKFSLLFLRKTNGTKDFPVLQACRSYAVFTKLSEHRMLSIPIKFLIYQAIADETYLFTTQSLNTFQGKFYKFLKHGIDIFIHRNCLNDNARKVVKKDIDYLLANYQPGERFSFNEIFRRLNAKRVAAGHDDFLSRSTVRRLIKYDPRFAVATLARGGSESIDKVIANPLREPAFFAGDRYQIDGTRFNVLYQNHDGKVSFLCMVVALDVYSKKVVGYSLSATESFANYIDCIKMSVKSSGFLPAEILTDNFSAGSTTKYKHFADTLIRLGTAMIKHKPGNPQAKGSIENWFHLFGEMYLKSVKGYLGDGIKSRNRFGKPNSEMIAEARKRKNIRTEAELAEVFKQAIIQYNSTYKFKNATPNNLFAECQPQNVISLDDDLMPVILLEWGTRRISSNCIDIIKAGKTYQYLIYDKDFILKYLWKEVVIRYSKSEHTEILIYEKAGLSILLRVKLHKRIVEAAVNRTPQQDIELYQYAKKRDKLKRELANEVKAFKTLMRDIPLEAVHYRLDPKVVIEAAEDAAINKVVEPEQPVDQEKERKKDVAVKRPKKVKMKFHSKPVIKEASGNKETSERLVISFNDMFKVTGSNRLLE